MKTVIMPIIGVMFLVLGAIGLFIPVWPTTPFVIISVGCLSSTPKIRTAVLRIPFFRDHFENYNHRKGLSRKTLISSLIFLWGMLLISAVKISTWQISILLAAVGIAVTTHIHIMAKPKPTSKNTSMEKSKL